MKNIQRKKKKNKLIYSVLLLVVLVVATLIYILKDFKLKDIITILKNVKFRYVFVSLLMVVFYVFFEGFALKISMKSLKHKITWRGAIAYSAVDYFFSGITPSATGGQPVQVFYMKKDGIPIHKSTIGILLNTIMYKLVLMSLGLFACVFFPEILSEAGTIGLILFILGFVINIIAVIACFMAIYWKSLISKIILFFIFKLAKWKIIKNVDEKVNYFKNKLDEYSDSAHYLRENKSVGIKLFIVNFIQRLCLFSITYFAFRALGYSHLTIYYLLAIQIIVAMSVDSMPFPGGVGLSEILLTTLFTLVYPSEEILASALLLTRGINFYFALLFTGLIVLINHIRLVVKSKEKIDIHEELINQSFKEDRV